MIVTNNIHNTNGSNALAPQQTPSRHVDGNRQRDLEKLKHEHLKRNKQKAVNRKARILKTIALSFILGITVVYRYSVIYNMEKDILSVKSEISRVNSENENLKVGLLKYNNIKDIENNAINDLDMVSKHGGNVIYIDLEKNNFKSTLKEEIKVNEGIVMKLKDIFY